MYRQPNNTKPHSISEQTPKKNTVGNSEVIKGKIGDAQYTLNKTTKNMVITAHGMPFRTGADGISSAEKMSSSINRLAQDQGSINNISLRSCYSANGGCFSQGQVIADQTKTKVAAYKGKYTQQGGGPQNASGGNLKIFEPTQDLTKQKINLHGNKLLGKPLEFGYSVVKKMSK